MSTFTITAADVKNLRDLTGAGMMDCKKALNEAAGDMDKAVEILRKKGQKLSAKRADRDATEGAVIALVNADHTNGIVIKLSCETDFVSKNEAFVALATEFANIALENKPADTAALLALPYKNITVGEKIIEQIGVIGEKLELANYESISAPCVAEYVHMGNKAGVLVALTKHSDAAYNAGRDVAMQVAAMKPVAVDQSGVNQDIIAKEIEIGKEIARKEGKPETMLEKIATGKLNKFFKENTLLPQAFVKNSKQSVEQYLDSVESGLTVTDFKHVTLG